MFAYLI